MARKGILYAIAGETGRRWRFTYEGHALSEFDDIELRIKQPDETVVEISKTDITEGPDAVFEIRPGASDLVAGDDQEAELKFTRASAGGFYGASPQSLKLFVNVRAPVGGSW